MRKSAVPSRKTAANLHTSESPREHSRSPRRLRGNQGSVAAKLTPSVPESEESEEQYDIVTSFGMFWRRNAVEWSAMPKLLGMQQIGATPVDFNKQLGSTCCTTGVKSSTSAEQLTAPLAVVSTSTQATEWQQDGIDSLGSVCCRFQTQDRSEALRVHMMRRN